mgnify:CR=1 FL=1
MVRKAKEKRGITLIALVVTIVVLLILAGITINMLFSNGGIFKTAQDAANAWNEATINEQESLNNLAEQIENLVNGQTGGGEETPEEPVDITTVTDIVQKEQGQKAKDSYGNIVVVPKGFKVVVSEGTTVPEGIVIEDVNGNQFVWIPVGTVHKDNNPANDVTIKLGRYTFDTTNGKPTPAQLAYTEENPTNYINTDGTVGIINSCFTELSTYRTGTIDDSNHLNDVNATAKNLTQFVESAKENGGYYLARYEASYGSGNSIANWKPLSKESTGYDTSHMNKVLGTLWNLEIQINASKICQNMYKEDNSVGVESDLINSYAWDTAIVFIQEMGNSNYANKTDGNGTLKNTGEIGDEVCNIFDMAANIREWTTEYSTHKNNLNALPCTNSGGYYLDNLNSTAFRNYHVFGTLASEKYLGFRQVLYIK